VNVLVNGELSDCEGCLTVAQLIQRHGLSPETTLVEHNGVALRARDWAGCVLHENDRLEILRVAAGG